ncbi:hypothetical protein [Streptomyces collinus]|uniref:hypothetical protein n=1 Tax=Streptomyces collinus TaxID=42684 RepID=UPI0033CE000A
MSTLAFALVASTPLVWLLDGPSTGQLVGATVQVVVAVAALVWTWVQPTPTPTRDRVARSGRASADDGALSVTGIRRRKGRGGGSATAEDTGDATAREGGTSVTGIDYT